MNKFKCTFAIFAISPDEIVKPYLKKLLSVGFEICHYGYQGDKCFNTGKVTKELTYAEIKKLHGKNGFFKFKANDKDITLADLIVLPDNTEVYIEI
jgi:hypothetical protein